MEPIKPIDVYLDEELYERVSLEATKDGTSKSSVIKKILKQHFTPKTKRFLQND